MKNVKELRSRIERERRSKSGNQRLRFSAGLKRMVIEFVAEARLRGVSDSQLLADLGIGPATLIRWCGRRGKSSVFRQVSMVRASRSVAMAKPVVAIPTVIDSRNSPIAIVGLTVAQLAELCRSLSC
jgi:hypothetical protein